MMIFSRLKREIHRRHEEAIAKGNAGYMDPDSGLFVLTSKWLQDRGYCCGSGCRHCPYSEEQRRQAGHSGMAKRGL